VRGFLIVAAVSFAAMCPGGEAQAQTGIACDAFMKGMDGTWTALRNVPVPAAGRVFNIRQGATFRPGASFMGMDLAAQLEEECKGVSTNAAAPQVEITKFADTNGNIDVQKLTCGQLADTYQEDADLLLAWYSGWSSGAAKAREMNVARVKDAIHNVVVYCKANKDKQVSQAVDVVMRQVRR
jgi:hypothetical protein